MITENLSTLKIHRLTKVQYERELAAGRIDENALYLTPDEENITLADIEGLQDILDNTATKSNTLAGYGIEDAYTSTQVDDLIAGIESGDINLTNGSGTGSLQQTNVPLYDGTNVMNSTASGKGAVALGYNTEASGDYAFAQGYSGSEQKTTASGYSSVALGEGAQAKGRNSYAQGEMTQALERGTHAEGKSTKAFGMYTHAEGQETEAGSQNESVGTAAHAEGYKTKATGNYSHAEGQETTASSGGAHAEGIGTSAAHQGAHAEGYAWVTDDNYGWYLAGVYTEGIKASAKGAHAEGYGYAKVIGGYTDNGAEMEYHPVIASGIGSHAEGVATQATAQGAHAEGNSTTAYGEASHAEGRGTNAAVLCAHAEGARTTASGAASHAEGADTVASGNRSHAEGSYTIASGSYSHAEGFYTKAESGYMHAQGKYNKTTSGYAHVVGWGEDEDNRKDIHRLSTDGGAWFAGKLYSGNNEIATNLSNGYKVIDGNRTEIPGALRQCNLTLSLDSVKEYIIGKAYVKDECCWYNAGTEDVPVWELYRCTTSYGEAKTDTFIDLKDTYWELIDTSVEGFNFNNLKIPAQGYNPKAEGIGSFAVGYNTKAYKSYSFASGNGSVANKSGAHAEGYQTYADANASHTEGTFTQTHGDNSHAEGTNTVTTGHDAHAEGTDTGAAGLSSHTEGYQTIAGQFIEVITENLTIVNEDSIPTSTFAKGTCVKYVLANGSGYRVYYCPANNIVFSEDSWVRAWFVRDSIIDNITYQLYALAVSDKSQFGEHAEGYQTIAQGQSAHAEGTNTKALADFAHAEGQLTSATGVNAHAEGRSSSATKDAAHAEGVSTTASALAAHAEGQNTVAEGQASHAEGARTTASGAASHAEGADTVASGNRSHAEGEHTVASEAYQHVQGRYNIVDSNNKAGNYAHIVGNGTSIKRSNAHTLDWQGNAWFAGDVTVGTNKDKLATEEYVDTSVANLGKLTTQDVTDALGYTPANKQHTHPVSQIGNLSSQLDAKMPKAGGTFTGAISSSADKANGTAQFRNSIVASSVPSDLSALKVGDMIYVEGESSGGGSSYTLPVATSSTLGGVKSGGDVSINSSTGIITVNDDSHNHVISNIDGLQTQLNNFTTEDRVIELIGMYATCLIEGTPINMADGTTKAIEDIEPGDLIKSYNPVTKELTEAVAIASVYTGANRNFTVHNFEDGRCVTTFGQHAVYDAVEGTTFDIQNITRSRRMINIDNEETLWADKRSISFHGKRKKRYGLISSNNLYFANGILLGHKPYNKLEHIEDRCKGIIDPEIRKVWEQDCDDYTAVTAVTDQSMYTELKDIYKEYAETRDQISKHKKLLSGSDYKSIKRNEGHIDDVEWLSIAADRQKWRNVINENEARYTGLKQQIDKALAARRPQGWTSRSLFEQCCARDNAAFELVKAYFEEQNSSAD